MNEYINVQFFQFPSGIHGASTANEDNGFTIFIDPRDTYEKQLEAYNHEMEHIRNGDFDSVCDKTARKVELGAHRKRL